MHTDVSRFLEKRRQITENKMLADVKKANGVSVWDEDVDVHLAMVEFE